jgi:hypothetical protein
MSEFRVNSITNQDGSAGPQVCGVSTFSGKSGVQIPSGSSDFRRQDGGGRGRGLFMGGTQPGNTTISTINLVQVSTTGDATDFGDLSDRPTQPTTFGDSTRGCVAGGNASPYASLISKIEYITFSSGGGGNDFGNLTEACRALSNGCSDATRGLRFGGVNSATAYGNVIDFVTIATTGDATEFGNLLLGKYGNPSVSNGVRGLNVGNTGANVTNINIEFVNIQSGGNAEDFGQMISVVDDGGSCCDKTRGVFATSASGVNTLEFITMATFGNATDFGDLTDARRPRGCSNQTRGVFGGGADATDRKTIDFITIQTTGNATDFGDLITAVQQLGAVSDIHGGLAQ